MISGMAEPDDTKQPDPQPPEPEGYDPAKKFSIPEGGIVWDKPPEDSEAKDS